MQETLSLEAGSSGLREATQSCCPDPGLALRPGPKQQPRGGHVGVSFSSSWGLFRTRREVGAFEILLPNRCRQLGSNKLL